MFRSLILLVVFLSECIFPQVISLRDTTNQFDYVVVTTPDLISSCELFKQHKESLYGIKVLLVDTTMIYSEFDTASTKADDIRNFISYAGTFWKSPRPKYFLIAGDVQKIPTLYYQISPDISFPTDYIYSQSIYEMNLWTVEFYIGRVPATDTSELNNYFNKIITYENDTNTESWENNVLVASEYEPEIIFGFNQFAQDFSSKLPAFITPELFPEEDSLHQQEYRQMFIDKINQNGFSSVWYFGHSRDTSIGYSNYFNNAYVNSLINSNKLFFVSLVGVHHMRTDSSKTLMDELILSQNGAVSGFTSIGFTYWGIINYFDTIYVQKMYSNDSISVGQVMDIEGYNTGYFMLQKILVNLWGDPSLHIKFNYPLNAGSSQSGFVNDFQLLQNYPNPFNPTTTINYTVPKDGSIKLVIYDLLGREVKTLVNGFSKSGNHQVVFDASFLSSGVYFYKLLQGNSSQIKKMILLK